MLLEIIVQSLEDALAAEAGGADRLEVVREIDRDGLTPSIELVRKIASATQLPLRVMVRESDGFSLESSGELATLQRQAAALSELRVDGIVIGFARGGTVDLETTRAVLAAAPGLRATFHRAFDTLSDPKTAIALLRDLPQIDRILTSGGDGAWPERCRRLADYSRSCDGPIRILAGSGVDVDGVRALADADCVNEVHVGRAAREPQLRSAPVSAERVRQLKKLANRSV